MSLRKRSGFLENVLLAHPHQHQQLIAVYMVSVDESVVIMLPVIHWYCCNFQMVKYTRSATMHLRYRMWHLFYNKLFTSIRAETNVQIVQVFTQLH